MHTAYLFAYLYLKNKILLTENKAKTKILFVWKQKISFYKNNKKERGKFSKILERRQIRRIYRNEVEVKFFAKKKKKR